MKGMGYFQNLRNFLKIFWIFLGMFWEFLRRIFLKEFLWRNFFGGIFWRIFWEDFLGGNHSIEINKELIFLSRFWGNFVSKKKEGRKEGGRTRNLDP